MQNLEDIELGLMDLEQRLRPIADRPVDITKPAWAAQLAHSPHPSMKPALGPKAKTCCGNSLGSTVLVETRNARQSELYSWNTGLLPGLRACHSVRPMRRNCANI